MDYVETGCTYAGSQAGARQGIHRRAFEQIDAQVSRQALQADLVE